MEVSVVKGSEVVIYAPKTTVTFQGDAQSSTVTTAKDTFIVALGSSIATLYVQQGDVDIYGAVTTLERTAYNTSEYTYVDLIGDAAKPTLSGDYSDKVVLLRDGVVIDYTATKTVETDEEATAWIEEAVAAGAESVSVIITGVDASGYSKVSLPETSIPISVKFEADQSGQIIMFEGGAYYTGELTFDVTGNGVQLNTSGAENVYFYGSAKLISASCGKLIVTSGATLTTLEIAVGNAEIWGSVTTVQRTIGNSDELTYVDLIGEAAVPAINENYNPEKIVLMRDGVVIEEEVDYSKMIYVETADEAVAAIQAAYNAGVKEIKIGYKGTYNEETGYYEYGDITYSYFIEVNSISIEYLNETAPYSECKIAFEYFNEELNIIANQANMDINIYGGSPAYFYGKVGDLSVNLISSTRSFISADGSVIDNLYLEIGNSVYLYGEVTNMIKNSSEENTSTVNIYDGAVEPVTYEGDFTLYKNGTLYVRAYTANDVYAALDAAASANSAIYI